jgi:CHAT domain-containing protein
VRLDTLALTPDDALRLVRESLASLQGEAPGRGRWLGPRAAQSLAELSRALLPADLEASADPALLEISADGPLAALPFEALPVARRNGAPLAICADVAYVHGWAERSASEASRSLVLASPAVSAELRRRYASIGSLDDALEWRAAARRWPNTTVLRGASATKAAFLANAGQAANLYVAAHHVHDPETPFLGFIPLAAGRDGSRGADYLEEADIRALDLSACRLAVLASCSSGAPYRMELRPGSSFGDAFLDAGAHAVVQSHWDVADAETRAFMSRYLAALGDANDVVRALNRTRRAAMTGSSPAPPRVWAAWSAAVTWPRPNPRLQLAGRP